MKLAKKPQKKKNIKIKKQIKDSFILTIIICIIIFIVYKVISLINAPTKTFILQKSTISSEESKVGYVVRDEYIVEDTKGNEKIEPIKNEGERVSVNNPIFKYYSVNEEEINKQIEELNSQIQEALNGRTDLFPGDVKSIENQIEEQIENLRNENNMQNILEYKSNISDYIVKKAKIAGSLSSAGVYINSLISQRNSLEETLNNGAEYVYSKSSGIVSYRIDGLENVLTVNNLENLTQEYLDSLELTTGQIVTKNDNNAKVINNFECYIVINSNSEDAKNAKEGKTVTLKLSNQDRVKAEIYKIKDDGNGKLIIFKITDGVEKLINYRKISIDVIWWEYQGLIVPKNSILYENAKSYIVIKRNSNFDKILIKVRTENDNYCLIDNYDTDELISLGYTTEEINSLRTVKIYDEIMLDPEIK